jgi:3-deoxy-D-manno-octulosonate 8-phosphate phosphatase (KDO 8-P phosphatase)
VLDAALAGRLKLIGFDVDGVLTDGGIFLGQVGGQPAEFKRFDVQDGLAVRLLHGAGIVVVLVSGRISEATTVRAREIGVDDLIQDDATRKLPAFEAVLARRGVGFEECAYVGDDLIDLPLLRRVALPIAVPNARPEVRAAARYVTTAPGGQGAVREIAETILQARGVWDAELNRIEGPRSMSDAVRRSAGSR